MQLPDDKKVQNPVKAWLRKAGVDLVILALIAAMVIWMATIAWGPSPDKASWLLVPVTCIYGLFTLWIAAASFKGANASLEAAKAMRASVDVQIQQLRAAYGAEFGFPEGQCYQGGGPGESASIVLGNTHHQPVTGLHAYLWALDRSSSGILNVKPSTLIVSESRDITKDTFKVVLQLAPSRIAECDSLTYGTFALERFRNHYKREPQFHLCMLVYRDRSMAEPQFWVYDLRSESNKT